MDKIKLSANILFSGLGMQERGFQNSELFDVDIITTSDIDKDAIVSYASMHNGLTRELVENYNYPSKEEMIKDMERMHIGFDPNKNKETDWVKVSKKKDKMKGIEIYWLACKLSNQLGDISRIEKLPYADLWTISFPCFVEGTLVLTKNGYKEIQEIQVGDEVLTHTNKWQKVSKIMTNEANKLLQVKCMPSETIHCTENHPFYVRKKYRKWNEPRRSYDRLFTNPEWIKAKDLSRDYYVGTAINQIEEFPKWDGIQLKKGGLSNRLSEDFNKEDFWYIIGRYVGDGWIRNQGGICICANDTEMYQITPYLDRLNWGYSIVNNRTVNVIHIPFIEIGEYCKRFGRGASNKHLTSDILNLPVSLLKAFLDGYIAADGSFRKNLYKITSVSRQLIYEIGECVAKAYHRPSSIYFTERPKTTVIEGRTVNQKDTYQITFKLTDDIQDKAFYEDGYIWSPINDIIDEEYEGLVYNMEVENDNSYVVQNVIVHNCTDISVAGKMKGLSSDSGTRSSLLWENIRLLKDSIDRGESPKYLMFENVKNLVSKKFINDFNSLLEVLEELGFNSYWKVLNGCECGIPQNRQRVFVISIRKDIDTSKMDFPIPFDNGLRLKDLLQPANEIDEKYYINTDRARNLIEQLVEKGQLHGNDRQPCDSTIMDPETREISNCITARYDASIQNQKQIGMCVAEPIQKRLGGMWDGDTKHQAGSVWDDNGLAPTLDTAQGGGRMPHIIENTNKINQLGNYIQQSNRENPQRGRVYDAEYISPTLNCMEGGNLQPCNEVYSTEGVSQILCAGTHGYATGYISDIADMYRIRKLTPIETGLLMGLTRQDVEKCMENGISNSALYKQHGNGICVPCVGLLAEHLYKAQYDNNFICTDEKIATIQGGDKK